MGIVLAFPARPENQNKTTTPKQGLGEVTIFLGIRIERREFTDEERARLGPPSRARGQARRRNSPVPEKSGV